MLFFQKLLNIFIEFLAKIWTRIKTIWKYAFVRGSGAEPPEPREFLKNRTRKSYGNKQFFEKFHEFWENFLLKTLILINT